MECWWNRSGQGITPGIGFAVHHPDYLDIHGCRVTGDPCNNSTPETNWKMAITYKQSSHLQLALTELSFCWFMCFLRYLGLTLHWNWTESCSDVSKNPIISSDVLVIDLNSHSCQVSRYKHAYKLVSWLFWSEEAPVPSLFSLIRWTFQLHASGLARSGWVMPVDKRHLHLNWWNFNEIPSEPEIMQSREVWRGEAQQHNNQRAIYQ